MPGRAKPNNLVFMAIILIALMAACMALASLSIADSSDDTDDGQMEKQRHAYQSEQNLVKAVQKRLDTYGYPPGPVDGILGPLTKAALSAYQKDNGLTAGGQIDLETLIRLDLIRKPD